MSYLKELLKKLIKGKYANSHSFIKFLREQGCTIGERTVIYSPKDSCIDITRPWLIDIGNDVKITRGVTILTHGYDWSVIKNVYNEMLGSSGRVTIGNNVFIGMNTTILKGVTIGDNVIIGACSLVNKNIPSNSVYTGNPCNFIMTLEDYYKKRKAVYINEAKDLALSYYEKYNKRPPIEIFGEFFPLFLPRDISVVKYNGFSFDGKFEENVVNHFLNSVPQFDGYDDFLKWCGLADS